MLQQELKSLVTISETPYNTKDRRILGCSIQDEIQITNLVILKGSVEAQEFHYNAAGDALVKEGIITSYPVFTLEGVSVSGITSDINLRLKILNTKERKEKLEKLMNGYRELMTNEDKQRILDAEMKAFLGES